MGLEFLARVRRTTFWMAAVAALLAATYAGPFHGLAMALGALWSLANLRLLQELIVALTGPSRSAAPERRRALLALTGMMMLFGAGAVLLATLPPASLLWGFLVPFAVIVLKAAAALLLGSRAWKAVTASPWRAALIVIALAATAWLAAGGWSRATAGDGAVAAVQEHGEVAAHGEAAHGEAHGGGGPEKFANVITILARAFPEAEWAHFLHGFEAVLFAMLVAVILCVVAFLASRNPQMVPGPLQNGVEWVVEQLYDFVIGILGPKHGPRYVPFLGTLFVYILAMNLFGLIPFMDSPTSNLNITLALSLTVFVYAQWIGFRELGVIGYIDHMAGNPRTLVSWLLVPLMLPIHVLGELAKPISLSCRLFGNIFGEDMLLVAFASLGVTVLSFTHLPFGLPLQLPFLFLALLTSTLQALVFTVLSIIYFLLMLPHDEHDHAHEHEGEVQHAHP